MWEDLSDEEDDDYLAVFGYDVARRAEPGSPGHPVEPSRVPD